MPCALLYKQQGNAPEILISLNTKSGNKEKEEKSLYLEYFCL